jgi:hypothetical protein
VRRLGDFNLPDINWKMNDVTGNQVPKTISKAFLHMSADLSIQQVNDHPTRENNILDLLFTSHPGHVERCKTRPPIEYLFQSFVAFVRLAFV